VRTVTPLAASSTGASNHIRRSPIRRPAGSRDAYRTAEPPDPAARTAMLAFPAPVATARLLHSRSGCLNFGVPPRALSRNTPLISPIQSASREEETGGRGTARQAAARHNCTALCLLPPSLPPSLRPFSPLVLLHSALPHSARYPNTRTSSSRLHRRRRAHGRRGEGDAAGRRRRLWFAGARWEWDTPVVQSHGAELLRRGRVHAPLRRGAQQHPVL
jgi:hypothetical protein